MSDLVRDIRYAVRTLLRSPGFTAVAVLALALGIGANTAIFSVVNVLLLRPLPFPGGDRLVEIWEGGPSRQIPVAYPDYLDWRAQNDVFEEMAIQGVFPAVLTGMGPAERIGVKYVSAGFLATYRAEPLLGRDFTAEDDRDGAPPVALISYAFWQQRFGGSPQALGRTLAMDKASHTVIGILPPSFRDSGGAQIYAPYAPIARRYHLVRGNHDSSWVVARRKPGATIEAARAQMDAIARRLEQQYPDSNKGIGVNVRPLRQALTGRGRQPALILMGAVALVLLIACANVANLLLARGSARRRELAVRAALGAGRRRLIRQLLVESVLLAAAGGALGILLARWSFAGLARLVPISSTLGAPGIDGRVLAFTFAVALVTGLAFGLLPALRSSGVNLAEAMRAGGQTGADSHRLRRALAASEVALAFVLLAGAGLLMRTLHNLLSTDTGFQPDRVVTMRVTVPFSDDAPLSLLPAFYSRLVDHVADLPGVEYAGVTRHIQFSGGSSWLPFEVEGRPSPDGNHPQVNYKVANAGFFRAMRIPLLRGRFPEPSDGVTPDASAAEFLPRFREMKLVAVISESLARTHWPGQDPVGRRLRIVRPDGPGPWVTVLGVVGDAKHGLDAEAAPTLYFSSYQYPDNNMFLVVRTRRDPRTAIAAIREAVRQTDANAPVTDIRLLEEMVAASVSNRTVNAAVLTIFAALALALAAIGVYGVMAYSVARRTREIGIRMALGATAGGVLGSVLKEACVTGTVGVAVGAAAALGLTRVISSMLYGVSPVDALTYAAVAVGLLGFTLLAGYIPARRAMRVDPAVALRDE